MYVATLLLLLGAGLYWCVSGAAVPRRLARILAGVALIVITAGTAALMSFWGEMLWFSSVGYPDRFWTEVFARLGALALGVALSVGVTWGLVFGVETPRSRRAALALGGLLGMSWGFAHWDTALLYLNRVQTGVVDPVLGRDVGFYLFALPMCDALQTLLLLVSLLALATVGVERFSRSRSPRALRPLLEPAAALAIALALGRWLARYHLLYSGWGAVVGPGWTDVHVRLPALWVIAATTALLGLMPLVPPVRRRLARWRSAVEGVSGQEREERGGDESIPTALAVCWGALGILWLLGLGVAPGLAQWLRVQPNEITLERPYIENNIRFTRAAFDLADADEREFTVAEAFSRRLAEENEHLVSEIRLWDWRALDAVYQQFQEIRLYYEFNDVDIDRYELDGRKRQVMVSAREMSTKSLPPESQTFVNRRFKYTHGYGLTLTPVSEFTPGGLPNLLVKDIPPVTERPELQIDRAEIYYGELTDEPVYVNTREKEFDLPTGDENLYTRYSGTGGVRLSSLWRRIVYGWKFDGTRFLVSGYLTPESRVQFHRNVTERVRTLAPFLTLDRDPYVVLAEGKIYWIVDAYTTSKRYPYSERLNVLGDDYAPPDLNGVNYVRNSVKAVVDAFEGSVTLYVFDPDDPVLEVWRRIYPSLFRSREEMPAALERHIRYPEDLLLAQGLTYRKYHMTDPEVFYNQEDLWVRATEKYYDEVVPVEPYYVMWQRSPAEHAELILMMPFTPRNRQVLIGWIAGLSAPRDYGKLLTYKFPKEERILGPQQVETKIDQDRYLASQLTLWDQRGSDVIRGNVLAIPIDGTLLYVEPIYLEADTAAYPELRLVVLMNGDRLSYGETLEEALEGLFSGERERSLPSYTRGAETERETETETETGPMSPRTRGARASEAFERYLALQSEKRFEEAARALQELERLLEGFRNETTD